MSATKVVRDLRSRQLNPCDRLYWLSRGFADRPDNWKERIYGTDSDDSYEEEDDYEYSDDYSEDDESEYDDEVSGSNSSDYSSEYDSEFAHNCNKKNPNNDAFWIERGWTGRPHDWKERYVSGRY